MTAPGTDPAPGSRQPPPGWLVARLRAAGCVFAEEEAAILVEAATSPAELSAMADRRVDGLPLEHVVGRVEFAGRRILVDVGVFVPRRRSELLVREAVAHLVRSFGPGPASRASVASGLVAPPAGSAGSAGSAESAGQAGSAGSAGSAGPVVVDLCCGCGAIGVAIAAAVPGIELFATDLDPVAVRCAARNLASVSGTVAVGDLFEPLPSTLRGGIDVLVANAPYVPTGSIALMPAEARDHEPTVALDGGPDGTDILRRVIVGAPEWLGPAGMILVEVGEPQIPAVVGALGDAGLVPRIVADDELGGIVATGRRR